MIPTTIVEHDQSGIEMILDALDQLKEERFIEGIRNKHHSLYEIEQTTNMVKLYQARVNIESKALQKFSETFIREFATNNNQCFNTAEVLFKKLSSTLAGLKQIFHKTTPIDRRQLPNDVAAPSVYSLSPLANGEYSPDMFGLESYPEQVTNLYKELDTLFTSASAMLTLCHLMIEQEQETRNDVVQLKQIYQESCDVLLEAVKTLSSYIDTTCELPENDLERYRLKAASDDEFYQEGYHKCNKKDLTEYLVKEEVRKARNDGLTDTEMDFWRGRKDKVLMIRTVIRNFDLIKDVKGKGNSLSSTIIIEFLKWCDVTQALEKKLYEEYFCKQYQGTHDLLKWGAISACRKEHYDNGGTTEQLVNRFEERLAENAILHPPVAIKKPISVPTIQ